MCALALAACLTPEARLDQATQLLVDGHVAEARKRYEALGESPDVRVRIRASLGAAKAAAAAKDAKAQRFWIEQAKTLPETPGLSEEAYYQWAEILRSDGDRPGALRWYYRSAALAERAGHSDLYQRASNACAAMSMTP